MSGSNDKVTTTPLVNLENLKPSFENEDLESSISSEKKSINLSINLFLLRAAITPKIRPNIRANIIAKKANRKVLGKVDIIIDETLRSDFTNEVLK